MNHPACANTLFYAGPISVCDLITQRSNVVIDSRAHKNTPRQSILDKHCLSSLPIAISILVQNIVRPLSNPNVKIHFPPPWTNKGVKSSLHTQVAGLDFLVLPQLLRGRLINNPPLAHDINVIRMF